MAEIYVSTDVETDGPIPGVYSMLSLGSAAFTEAGEMVGTFSANLEVAEGAVTDAGTMVWWATQPEAWAAHRDNLEPPEAAMKRYAAWLKGLPGKPVFVGYPAGFDFTFVYWGLVRYAGESPFSFSALDIKTYAMAVLGTPYRGTSKKTMPGRWFGTHPHTHLAVDDAIEQGHLFVNMLREAGARRASLPPYPETP